MLELIAFPLPGEVLMSYAGFLVFKGQLGWLQSIVVAAAGATTGITLSYLVGYKLGAPFFNRYGKHIHMGPERRGKLMDVGLRSVFHRLGPASIISINNLIYTFPSGQTLMRLTTFGFAGFILLRHSRSALLRTITSAAAAVIFILVGISRIYLNLQYPSDVISGYVFGGVWLSLNIILLEVFRVLRKADFPVN